MSVCITGVGAITALGDDAEQTFARVLAGERAFAPLTLFDAAGYRVARVAEVHAVPPFDGEDVTGRSRTSEMAIRAGREALAAAGLTGEASRQGLGVGLVVGSTTSGMFETEALLAALAASPDAPAFSRQRLLSHPLSAATERVDVALGPFDRVRTLSSACSSGANALVVGASWIELGLVDACLCGASDALCRVTLSGFGALGALDPDGARPFDVARRGLTLGEGAGFVVLERAEVAAGRGARVVAWLSGWGVASEAHHVTNPEPTGATAARVMARAMERAGVGPGDVDYVNAHGTGTPLNDAMETRAIRAALGDRADDVPVSSQKGQLGHTLAAAGAIEAVLTALAISRGHLPGTGGLTDRDPACDLALLTASERRPIASALSSSFGFGGMDTALLLTREPTPRRAAPSRTVLVVGASAVTAEGARDATGLGDVAPEPARGLEVAAELTAALDGDRARRLDRASRLACVAAARAGAGEGRGALVVGAAFGSVDATAAFVDRLRVKGARLASPAEFPSLVPSAPAGHVSTYLGSRGPACVVADLEASGEAAFFHALELLLAGDADEACACAVQEKSAIVDGVLASLFVEGGASARREGAGAVRLATSEAARDAGLTVLARVVEACAWRSGRVRLPDAPPGALWVVTGDASRELVASLDASSWRDAPRASSAEIDGAHEATGAIALARAASVVASGAADAALALGGTASRGYAVLLGR